MQPKISKPLAIGATALASVLWLTLTVGGYVLSTKKRSEPIPVASIASPSPSPMASPVVDRPSERGNREMEAPVSDPAALGISAIELKLLYKELDDVIANARYNPDIVEPTVKEWCQMSKVQMIEHLQPRVYDSMNPLIIAAVGVRRACPTRRIDLYDAIKTSTTKDNSMILEALSGLLYK